MAKVLVFDMDGTIADFYGVEGWLNCLNNSDPMPYKEAKPLYDMDILTAILGLLKAVGYRIIITSWLSKNATKEFDNAVRIAKREWLAKYNFPYDEIHLVKYGTTKADCTHKLGTNQILIDDNATIRKGWHLGETIDANTNIIEKLVDLLIAECS